MSVVLALLVDYQRFIFYSNFDFCLMMFAEQASHVNFAMPEGY